MADTPQISGVPPGVTLEPIQQSSQPSGVPPGVTLEPIQSQKSPTAQPSQSTDSAGAFTQVGRFAKGFGEGVLDTTAGIGEMIHKIPVVGPALIPAEGLAREEQLAESGSTAESVGKFAENIVEFAAGEEGLTGVAKFMKLATRFPEVVRAIEQSPKAAQMVINAVGRTLKTGAVGGAQSAVKSGGDVKETLKGAAGAAAGGAAAEVTGAIAKPVLRAVGLGASAEEEAMRAARPGKRNYTFIEDFKQAAPELKTYLSQGKQTLRDWAGNIREAREKIWSEKITPIIQKYKNDPVEPEGLHKLVKGITDKITPAMERNEKPQADAVREFASKFLGGRTIEELEQDLEHYNAELGKAGYWELTPEKRAMMEKADGYVASRVGAVKAMREVLSDHLEKAGETKFQDLKQLYGALRNVEKEVHGQVNVSERGVPISLKKMVGLVSGVPGVAATLLDAMYNDPGRIMGRAVAKAEPVGAGRAAAQTMAEGLGATGKKVAQVGGEKIAASSPEGQGGRSSFRATIETPVEGQVNFQSSDGKYHTIDAADLDAAKRIDPQLKVLE